MPKPPAHCPFCDLIRGAAEVSVCYEDGAALAFMDIQPVNPGHVLVVPREHHVTLAELPEPLVTPLFLAARRIAAAVERAYGCGGTFVAMNNRVSQSVPHLHVHVVPRTKGDGLRGFFWPRTKYGDGEAAAYAQRLREVLG